jgi:hypothetical protein
MEDRGGRLLLRRSGITWGHPRPMQNVPEFLRTLVRAIWRKIQRSFRSKQGRAGSPTSRSGGAAFVAMMQTAHFRECDDLAC